MAELPTDIVADDPRYDTQDHADHHNEVNRRHNIMDGSVPVFLNAEGTNHPGPYVWVEVDAQGDMSFWVEDGEDGT